ncbi:CBS domain-containing protein [Fontivita pretiosa]|uniref:CBS domain-containing protein n=1 Tax=Fontivita pretiosa TaxID=2989684 RepID=UPI003D186871
MFGKAYKLPFRLFGIPVFIDITFLIVLPLFTWIIGSGIKAGQELIGLDREVQTLRQGLLPYLLGLIIVIGLFVSVLIHELGHALTARGYGVKTRSITLWLLGGVAALDDLPRRRGAEAVIAIVGPIVSFALAGLFYLTRQTIPLAQMPAARFVVTYLAWTNVVLAIFNLLPALPLDGGRVLRSLLALRWDYLAATQVSATISKVLAVGLGLFGFLTGQLMLMLIAFFIYMAVNTETQQLIVERLLEGVRVRDLMNPEVITVPASASVAELTELMIRERHKGFPVVDDDGALIGMVDLRQLQGAPPDAPVAQIMSEQILTTRESAPARDVLKLMADHDFGRVIVLDHDNRMVGIITKTDVMRAIQVRLAQMSTTGNGWVRPSQLAHT